MAAAGFKARGPGGGAARTLRGAWWGKAAAAQPPPSRLFLLVVNSAPPAASLPAATFPTGDVRPDRDRAQVLAAMGGQARSRPPGGPPVTPVTFARSALLSPRWAHLRAVSTAVWTPYCRDSSSKGSILLLATALQRTVATTD